MRGGGNNIKYYNHDNYIEIKYMFMSTKIKMWNKNENHLRSKYTPYKYNCKSICSTRDWGITRSASARFWPGKRWIRIQVPHSFGKNDFYCFYARCATTIVILGGVHLPKTGATDYHVELGLPGKWSCNWSIGYLQDVLPYPRLNQFRIILRVIFQVM